jgi:endonuclease-3
MKVLTKAKRTEALSILFKTYPDAECALDFKNNWQLLQAVVLSAQTTDVSVNKVTPELFERWPGASDLSIADPEQVENVIRRIGMYRTKASNLIKLAGMIDKQYEGVVPEDFDKLIELPGVGRKTANVVLSVGFGQQHIAVDTHVFRVANRIGLCDEPDVLKTEFALMKNIPETEWTKSHHALIWHGRQICHARKPECGHCPLLSLCANRPS